MQQCLKCKSENMSERHHLSGLDDCLNLCSVPREFFSLKVPERIYQSLEVCMSCGFVEYYLDEKELLKLKDIRKY